MKYVFPDTTLDIDGIIKADGRNVDFIVPTLSGCSACSLDPVTNTSTDSFCVVCSGKYWIELENVHTVVAHVTWKTAEKPEWERGGILFLGDAIAKTTITSVSGFIDNISAVLVDGKRFRIVEKQFLGVPQINRVIFHLKE